MIDTLEKFNEYMEQTPPSVLPKMLLHACCGPCSSAVIEKLKRHFDITILYFNPCIYPESEYELRFAQFEKLGVKQIIKYSYNHQEYLDFVKGLETEKEGGKRCYLCYKERITKTYELAKQLGFSYFSTTLSISPHKNSAWINEIGLSLSDEETSFVYSDFKKKDGYLQSIKLSKEYNLYRQDYCGCEFSIQKKEE